MAENAPFEDVCGPTKVGDRVRLWIGPPKRGGFQYGRVIGVDNLGHRGIQIAFDQPVKGQDTCYATHDEVEVKREEAPTYDDGTYTREVIVWWERERPTSPTSASEHDG